MSAEAKMNWETVGIIILILLMSAIGALTSGCTYSHYTKQPDGREDMVNNSFLMKRDQVDINRQTNGAVRVTIRGSAPDSTAIEAAAKGAAKGTAEGMTGR